MCFPGRRKIWTLLEALVWLTSAARATVSVLRRPNRSLRHWVLSMALVAAWSARALGQAEAEPARTAAAEHFERGFSLAQRGDYERAAREFALAYDLDPKVSVLFNLGQAYAASGQHIAANDTLLEYLRLAHGQIEPERQRRAQQLIEVAESRIGRLWIEVEPEGAEVEVDGHGIGKAPLSDFVRLTAGPHALVVRSPKHETRVVNVTVRALTDSPIFVRLVHAQQPEPATLLFHCSVPDMAVWLDGQAIGKLPGRDFSHVPAGRHTIALRRPGYVAETVVVDIRAGALHRYDCRARVAPGLESARAATLVIASPDAGEAAEARAYVDGRQVSRGPVLLPSGRHKVELRAPNYDPWSRDVDLAPGTTLRIAPDLMPTEEYRKGAMARREHQQLWSKVALGAGLTGTATAVALAIVRSDKHDAWLEERDALNREDLAAEGVASRLQANSHEALVIERLNLAMVGAALIGGGSLALSAYLWLGAEPVPGPRTLSAHADPDGLRVVYGGDF